MNHFSVDQPPSYQSATEQLLSYPVGENPARPFMDVYPSEDSIPMSSRPALPTDEDRCTAAVKDLEGIDAVKVVKYSASDKANKYKVFDMNGRLLYKAIESETRIGSRSKFPKRQFCLRLVDQERKVVFRQYRRWIDDLFDGYDVSDEGHFKVAIEENVDDDWYGPTLGYVHPRVFSSLDFLPFQCLKPSFTIKNKDDLAMFRISRSNCNATLKFDITDVNNGSLVGQILKRTFGETDIDNDHFIVEFPKENLGNELKAVFLSATFILDLINGDGDGH